jgi:hypothetical protein
VEQQLRGQPDRVDADLYIHTGREMPGLGCDQGRAAVYRVVGHSAKVHGNPRDSRHHVRGPPGALKSAHSHAPAVDLELVTDSELAAAERSGHHRATAANGERPVDP